MKTFFFFIHALAQSNAIQFRADGTNRAYGNPNQHELQYLLQLHELKEQQ